MVERLDKLHVMGNNIATLGQRQLGSQLKMNWQPIETAPRDGTAILAYTTRDKFAGFGPLPNIARWQITRFSQASSLPYWSKFPLDFQPTHWMPLPEPPKSDEQ